MAGRMEESSTVPSSITFLNSEICRLMERVSCLKSTICISRTWDKVIDEKLVSVEKRLLNERKNNLDLRLQNAGLHDKLRLIEKKQSNVEARSIQYDKLVNRLPSIVENANASSSVQCSARDLNVMTNLFLKRCNSSPWIIEKQQYLHCLREDENRLVITRRQIALLQSKITERKALIDKHNHMSFQKFCLNIASFAHNQRDLRQLFLNEMEKKKELEAKISELYASDNETLSCVDEIVGGVDGQNTLFSSQEITSSQNSENDCIVLFNVTPPSFSSTSNSSASVRTPVSESLNNCNGCDDEHEAVSTPLIVIDDEDKALSNKKQAEKTRMKKRKLSDQRLMGKSQANCGKLTAAKRQKKKHHQQPMKQRKDVAVKEARAQPTVGINGNMTAGQPSKCDGNKRQQVDHIEQVIYDEIEAEVNDYFQHFDPTLLNMEMSAAEAMSYPFGF